MRTAIGVPYQRKDTGHAGKTSGSIWWATSNSTKFPTPVDCSRQPVVSETLREKGLNNQIQ